MSSTWNIREGLKDCRELRGMSQTELAKATGLEPSAISHFETGQRVPSLGNLIRLADALNVTLDVLVLRKTFEQRQAQRTVALAEMEGNCEISVGGLAVETGMYKRCPKCGSPMIHSRLKGYFCTRC